MRTTCNRIRRQLLSYLLLCTHIALPHARTMAVRREHAFIEHSPTFEVFRIESPYRIFKIIIRQTLSELHPVVDEAHVVDVANKKNECALYVASFSM